MRLKDFSMRCYKHIMLTFLMISLLLIFDGTSTSFHVKKIRPFSRPVRFTEQPPRIGLTKWPSKPPLQDDKNSSIQGREGFLMHVLLPPTSPAGEANSTGASITKELVVSSLLRDNPNVTLAWMRSTHSHECPTESDQNYLGVDGEPLVWPATNIGEIAWPEKPCLNANLKPVKRPCLQDTFGAMWGDPTGVCVPGISTNSTPMLLNVIRTTVTPENAAAVMHNLSIALQVSVIPSIVDLALVVDVLKQISQVAYVLTSDCIEDLATLIHGCLQSFDYSWRGQTPPVNIITTRRIYKSVDRILAGLQLAAVPEGVASAVSSRAALLVADIQRSGVTGIAASSTDENTAFSDVRPLSSSDQLTNDSLELSARLIGDQSEGRVSFVLFRTGEMFPHGAYEVDLSSRVISVTLANSTTDVNEACIEFELRDTQNTSSVFTRKCAHWDISTNSWSKEGCRLLRHDKITKKFVCRCIHFGIFSQIIDLVNESSIIEEETTMPPQQLACLQGRTKYDTLKSYSKEEYKTNMSNNATSMLLDMVQMEVTPDNVATVTRNLASVLETSDTPSAGDVMLVANSLVKVSHMAHALTANCIDDLASLMNGVLKSSDATRETPENVNRDIKATSSILNSVDRILANLQLAAVPEGVASAVSSRAALLVADIQRSGVTGIAASSTDENTAFSDVRPLSSSDQLTNDSLELSARLIGDQSKGRVSFVLIGTGRMFPQRNDQEERLNSRVVGVTLANNTADTCIEFELRPMEIPGVGFIRKCAYWDLTTGTWSTEGCTLIRHDTNTGRDVCQCTHLTHFGEIIGIGVESAVLDVISLIGCILSLLGLVGITLTAIFFKQWRSRLGNKILLHLSFSIGLTMVAFLGIALGATSGGQGNGTCIFFGVLLHYSVLASFCWMLVSASLQLLRFVVIMSARPPHFLLKGVLVGWVLPMIPVCVLLALGPDQQYNTASPESSFCYPSGLSLVLGVILPVAIAVFANLIFFCTIVYRVTCGRDKRLQTNVSTMSERRMAIRQLRMSILLFFLLGLSWMFGLLALLLPKIEIWQLIFSYLFCTTATIQGLALFLFFVIWERKTRALWLATLPDAIGKRGATSDTTSGVSPSTGTTSGSRADDETAPLRQRSTRELGARPTNTRTVSQVNNSHNQSPISRTRL